MLPCKEGKLPLVAVAMSGGVDSSVAALSLKQQGFPLVALFMKNWEEEGACPAAEDYRDVASVCEHLEIPYYAVNFTSEYRELVFSHFLSELRLGRTPNPDILCNREIKFKVLLDRAKNIGAALLATGHYCQKRWQGDYWELLQGSDPNKDQSYFLYSITQEALAQALFPIGHLHKSAVRSMARAHALSTASKKESMGICFIGKRNFREFVSQFLPYQRGNIVTLEGKIVGDHFGVAYYTLGQRHGLRIGGAGEAWFVVDKKVETNELVVVQGEHHPALFTRELRARELSWISDRPPSFPLRCQAKVRYRQSQQECLVFLDSEALYVLFDEPQRAVTPGQALVLYDGEILLGGGTIF